MSFKIKKPTSSNRTVRMPDTLIEKISQIATEQDVSFNQVVIQCCEYAIDSMENKEKNGKNKNIID